MDKFQNKYRNSTFRLQNWDYGSQGIYYITICTKNRESFFGTITDGKLKLSELRQICHNEWLKTPSIRPDMNLELGEFVVMPNHFHAILIIGKNKYNTQNVVECRVAMHRNPTFANNDHHPKNQFAPQSKNLASVIRGFKSSVTTYARKNDIEFNWQSLYYDHIIRCGAEYHRITTYIANNPTNWDTDTYKPQKKPAPTPLPASGLQNSNPNQILLLT